MSQLWIGTQRTRFVDGHGRQVILRGVNLGGDCKLPCPDGGTHLPSDFSDHKTVSFVGRPFPLAEADEHLGRIAGWGFNALRLLTTWEAVEHAGPRQYDAAYIEYLGQVCERAAAHGLAVFIDFHQDVWSRMSGGSGAPCWLFDKLGMDYTRFHQAGAVHVMQYKYDYSSPEKRQEDRYPTMSWPLNYRLPVNGIMWTAFFAGKAYTPDWMIDGVNVQDYLQEHYFGAVTAVAQRVKHLPNVVGFDTLNEPGMGWIGHKMTARPSGTVNGDFAVGLTGPAWTPLDGLKVASGINTMVPRLGIENSRLVTTHELNINPQGVPIWKDGVACPFEKAGAWSREAGGGTPDEEFFRKRNGKLVDPENDFIGPFFAKMASAMRAVRPDWLLFAEINPHVITQGRAFPKQMPENSVNANHWYDVALLVSKGFKASMTAAEKRALAERYKFQLGYLRMLGERINGGAPSLIGECGIPYDINDGDSYARWAAGERDEAIWEPQVTALTAMYEVLDALLLSSTQWNYTASNRNDLRIGDGWNQEDLSIFSRDQQAAGNDGGRAVAGFCRPYVQRAQGAIKSMGYERESGRFTALIEADPAIAAPTEIFLPQGYAGEPEIAHGANWSWDAARKLLSVRATQAGELRIALGTMAEAPVSA